MIPSQRCYVLLAIGGISAAVLDLLVDRQISLNFLRIYNLALLIATIIDAARVKQNAIEVTRREINRLSVGRDNGISLIVESAKTKAIARIRDAYPPEFIVDRDTLEIDLPAYSQQELTYSIHPNRRGEYEWGDLQVRQLGTLGLAWRDWKIPANQKVTIYPDLIGLRELSLRLALENSGAIRQARLGNGTEFAELREYRTGEDIRLIDWKATARRDRPVVRVLEPEREQTILILLDRGRLMTARVNGLTRFDWGLNATLSLAMAGLNRGDRVGVAVFDREVTTWIPPERGTNHLSKLVDRLAPLHPVLLEPDYLGAVTKVITQQTRRALVVVITDLVDVTASCELLGAMMRLTPRYLPFCVTLNDPVVTNIAHSATSNLKDIYRRAVALDLLAQRQVAFARLRQRGVLVLDAPCDRVSTELVDRYLQLKRRNLL